MDLPDDLQLRNSSTRQSRRMPYHSLLPQAQILSAARFATTLPAQVPPGYTRENTPGPKRNIYPLCEKRNAIYQFQNTEGHLCPPIPCAFRCPASCPFREEGRFQRSAL